MAADIDTNSSVPVVEGMQIRTSRATKTQAAPPRMPGRFRDDYAMQGRGAFWRSPGGVATGPPRRPAEYLRVRQWASPSGPDTALRCLLVVPGLFELSG